MSKTQIILLWTRKGEKQMNIANYGCAVQACKTAEQDVKVSPKKKEFQFIPTIQYLLRVSIPSSRTKEREEETQGNKMVKYF